MQLLVEAEGVLESLASALAKTARALTGLRAEWPWCHSAASPTTAW